MAYLLVLGIVVPLWLGVLALVGLLVVSTPFAMHHRLVGMDSMGNVVGRAALGLVLVPVLLYLTAGFGGAHAALARLLLCPEPDPAAAGLVEVGRSPARLADAFDAERRRIERDLHDVAQQRLVSLTMQLGIARHDLPTDSPAAAAVAPAHEQAKVLMVELRDLVRGISPRTPREPGLRAAVKELAAGSAIRVDVDADPGRFPPAVETVAFAAVSEALANAVKHAAATEAAAGGRLLISSPRGGPTILRVELPCAS